MEKAFRRSRDERGAQAVEFALIFTFALGPIIYALIAFGVILNTQITASQLAREAARSAAICWGGSSPTAAVCETAGANRYTQAATGLFSASPPRWSSCDGSGCGIPGSGTAKCASLSQQPSLTATIQVNAPIGLGMFGLPNVPVTGKATTPCGG